MINLDIITYSNKRLIIFKHRQELFFIKDAFSRFPCCSLSMENFIISFIGIQRPSCAFILKPEWNAANNYMSYVPSWIPWFWVVISYWKTNLFVWHEAAIICEKSDVWWCSWIIFWADNFTKIVTTFIIIIETKDHKVPDKWIFRIRSTNIVINYLSMLFNLSIKIFFDFFRFPWESHISVFIHLFNLKFKLKRF